MAIRLPEPYYQDASVTLYHGDAREILPLLPPVTVVITDPPWKVLTPVMEGNADAKALWGQVAPALQGERILIWLPITADPRDWLAPLPDWPYLRAVYIRRAIPGYFGRALLDGEIIHVLGAWPKARKGRLVIPGGVAITYIEADRINGHPGPRSLKATSWLVEWWSDPGDVLLDPFAGSGTLLRAAKDMGRQAIGIEIEERFCEIIATRMGQEVMELAQ